MTHPSKRKGNRFERECVRTLNAAGLRANRVPLSGAAGGDYASDLRLRIAGENLVVECKSRNRLVSIYKWLGDNDLLFVKADRCAPLAVMTLDNLIKLIKHDKISTSA